MTERYADQPLGLARNTDPSTSHEAASAILKDRTAIQRRVMEEFDKAGAYGLTDYELEDRCGSHNSTFRTRRAELVDLGHVRDSGKKRVHRELNNRQRVVWVAVPRKPEQLNLI
ncbi:MAG: hypothetical protein EOP83_06005 [Verrucomicrobiaceae bacterium]|nr:MAG: hypothetical protein EOP83_06005 [Verrucomicrobiaceae bacterium]